MDQQDDHARLVVEFESIGEDAVRDRLAYGEYASRLEINAAHAWLSRKEGLRRAASDAARDAREEEALAASRESNRIAISALAEAKSSNRLADKANRLADKANRLAVLALIIAAIAAMMASSDVIWSILMSLFH